MPKVAAAFSPSSYAVSLARIWNASYGNISGAREGTKESDLPVGRGRFVFSNKVDVIRVDILPVG